MRQRNPSVNAMRHVLRRLVHQPLFTVIAVATLAIGLGANAAIFSVVQGVLLKPLPFPHADELVTVDHSAAGLGLTVPDRGALRAAADSVLAANGHVEARLRITVTGGVAWLAWLGLHLIELMGGMRRRTEVLVRWGWDYLRWEWGPLLILTPAPDPDLPLPEAEQEPGAP